MYSQVEMLLEAHLRDLQAKAVMRLELYPGDHSKLKHRTLRNHVLDKCATANALALLDSQGAGTVPGVSPYSIPAGVPLPQMPVLVNLLALPNKDTAAPAQRTEEIPISEAEDMRDTKMDNMMKAFEAWTFQLSKGNEPRDGGCQTARAYAIQADHLPPHTAMNFPPPNAPTEPSHY